MTIRYALCSVLLLAASAGAQVPAFEAGPAPLRCSGHSVLAGGPIGIVLAAAGQGKTITLTRPDGASRTGPVVAESSMGLPDMEAFLACDIKKEDCMEKHFPGEADQLKLCVVGAVGLASFSVKEGLGGTYSFDLAKVRSGRMYHAALPTKWGCSGLVELFDAQGRLLGRLISAIEAVECR